GYIRGYLSVNEFHILLFILYIFCIVVYFNNIFTEKLLLLKNIGIQIDKKDSFENYTKFICKNEIENIFINEDVVLGMNNMVYIYRDIKKIFFYSDNIYRDYKNNTRKNDR
ncbi:hypothetical protein PFDG_04851, partial [Plasmodium falciparum Dd2]